jgi:hypothetical protein
MEKTVFAPNFWKDYLWFSPLCILPSLFGFALGIYMLISSILSWETIFWALLLILICQIPMYALIYGLTARITIDENQVSFRCLNFFWPFYFNEETANLKEINALALGYFLMKKIYPKSAEAQWQSMKYTNATKINEGNIGFTISYNKENADKTMSLPIIHSQDYYDAIKNLIENAGLKPSKMGFIFKREIKI